MKERKVVVVAVGTCPLGKQLLSLYLSRRDFKIFVDYDDFERTTKDWRRGVIEYTRFNALPHVFGMLLQSQHDAYIVAVTAFETSPREIFQGDLVPSAVFVNNGSVDHFYRQLDTFFSFLPK